MILKKITNFMFAIYQIYLLKRKMPEDVEISSLGEYSRQGNDSSYVYEESAIYSKEHSKIKVSKRVYVPRLLLRYKIR
jgi:hypothetical protein